MLNTTLIFIGTGAISFIVEQFIRLGIIRAHLFDNKTVRLKNLVAQNFCHEDIGSPKPEALKRRLLACQFEKNNPNIPSLQVNTYGDFLAISDEEIERIIENERSEGRQVIIVMASDYHPVQAKGNRIALKFGIPAFWVGIYRMAKAGEIIFYVPGYDLPCYRCITGTRYQFFDKSRLSNHLKGNFGGAGRSSGLPMAATFIDSILSFLIVGLIHIDIEENQHAKLVRRLLNEKRNFIQCQLDPDYLLNDSENIFSQIQGPDLIAFNTIFQREKQKNDCLDCRPFAINSVWENTDYTKENYRESLKLFSDIESASAQGGRIEHPLLKEYESYFPEWEGLLNAKLITENNFEIIMERNGNEVFKVHIGHLPVRKTIRNVKPGPYVVRSNTKTILWQGELEKQELIWPEAFPEQPLKLAADTGQIFSRSTREIKLLNGKINIQVFPEIESGRLEMEIKGHGFA